MTKFEYKEEYSEARFEKFSDQLVIFDTSELQKARECANRAKAQIYTEVDGDNGKIYSIKGIHFVNRIQYYVILPKGKEQQRELEKSDIGAIIDPSQLPEDERFYCDLNKNTRLIIKKYVQWKDDIKIDKIDIMVCDPKNGRLKK